MSFTNVQRRPGLSPRYETMVLPATRRYWGMNETSAHGEIRGLKPGDVVEVRPPQEILATLDGDAAIDAMPFMPEMLKHVGKRFTVTRRVEKICDTVSMNPPNSRRMHDTVLLDDLRCDGTGHDGCQAACRLYWKEAWLRPVDPESAPSVDADLDGLEKLDRLVRKGSRAVREFDGEPVETYRCQATEALRATEQLRPFDLRQYAREFTAGNVSLLRILRVGLRGIGSLIRGWFHLPGYLRPTSSGGVVAETRPPLNLKPGDLVKVRSKEEIARTIDDGGKTRGLWFDWEMLPYCGGHYRVRDRVHRIVDERSGRMINIATDCLILDGVVCGGECSTGRWFCPRAIYPYWREEWLERVRDADSVRETPEAGMVRAPVA